MKKLVLKGSVLKNKVFFYLLLICEMFLYLLLYFGYNDSINLCLEQDNPYDIIFFLDVILYYYFNVTILIIGLAILFYNGYITFYESRNDIFKVLKICGWSKMKECNYLFLELVVLSCIAFIIATIIYIVYAYKLNNFSVQISKHVLFTFGIGIFNIIFVVLRIIKGSN